MSENYWGNNPAKGRTKDSFIRGARLIPVTTVTEDYPLLKSKVNQWVEHYQRGHAERVLVTNSISYFNDIPHVLVRRDFPKTGGHIPAAQLVTALAVIPTGIKNRLSGRPLMTPNVIYL